MKRYVIFASDSSMTIIIIGVIFVVVIIHYSKKIEYSISEYTKFTFKLEIHPRI